MSLSTILQDNWSRGIVRAVEGQRIPVDGVYDAVNGVLDDDLGVYRRGGTTYRCTAAADTLDGLKGLHMYPGNRTIGAGDTTLYVLTDSSSSPDAVEMGVFYEPLSRIVGIGGYAAVRVLGGGVVLYGGSLKNVYASGGTITATNASAIVTGIGTAFLTNVSKGSLVIAPGGPQNGVGVVQSVDSNTSITLSAPWTATTTAAADIGPMTVAQNSTAFPTTAITAAGTVPKLLVCGGSRVSVSNAGDPVNFVNAEEFHDLPDGGSSIGAEGIGANALIFSTTGVWMISNLDYDITDDFGNPQRQVQQINKNLILWNDSGIATYRGGLIIPAVDGVYMFDLSGTDTPISANITPLYRSYVKAGYRPGIAAVHRNHYFLPIVNGTSTLIDVLVCRLDSASPAWVRWANNAASRSYTQHIDSTTGAASLYGTSVTRVTNLSACFTPDGTVKADADATNHVLTVVTRDFAVDPQLSNLWKYLRTRFQLTDAASDNPTIGIEYAVGPPELESWTSLGSLSEGTGETSSKIDVNKRAQSIRFRIKSSGPAAKLVIRSIELFYRGTGRL